MTITIITTIIIVVFFSVFTQTVITTAPSFPHLLSAAYSCTHIFSKCDEKICL